MRTGTCLVYHFDLGRIGIEGDQKILECLRAAQIGHAGVMLEHPQTLARCGDHLGGGAADLACADLREQLLERIGMTDPRMHPRQFAYRPIGERFGRR